MDSNGTKFHLLLGKDDWSRAKPGSQEWVRRSTRSIGSLQDLWKRSSDDAELTGLRWDADRNELTLAPQVFQFAASPRDRAPELSDRRGADRDRFANWYWIAVD